MAGLALIWLFVFQGMPSFDETQRWVANNGFAVVMATLLLFVLFIILNRVLGNIAAQITGAIQYFTSKLDVISTRQESSFDRFDNRMESMAERQAVATEKLADVLREQTAALVSMGESNRNILIFLTQNMAQLAAHRQAVEGGDAPSTGVVKPIQQRQDGGE